MQIKLGELEKNIMDYGVKIKETKMELLKKMTGYAWEDEDLVSFLLNDMRPFFQKRWDADCCCGYMNTSCSKYTVFIKHVEPHLRTIMEKDLAGVVVKAYTPLGIYWKLYPGCAKNIFSESPMELYGKNPEHFKLYFENSERGDQEKIVQDLFSISVHNEDVDRWLGENHADVVRKVGTHFVTS